MFQTYLTKIKAYIAIALLCIIIVLLVILGVELLKTSKLQSKINKLEQENKRATKEIAFFETQLQIQSDFKTSIDAIEIITNEKHFDEQKQNAINKIVKDFHK